MFPGTPRALLSFLVFLPALIVSAFQATAEVRLEAEIGFHGLFRLGQPFPVSVVLANSGKPADGVLELEVWKGGPSKVMAAYPFYHQREVFLAAGGRRRVQFTVHPDSMARPLKVTFRAPGVQVTREFDLRGHFSPSPVILLVTGSGAVLSVPLSGGLQAPVVSLPAGELPSDSRAYQGVWAVLFYEPSLRDLSTLQRAALDSWLVSGGRVLVLGGLHDALYREASLEAFLPVRVEGLRELAAIPNLEGRYGYPLGTPGRFWIQDARLTRGKVLIQEAGAPVLVEAPRGKGRLSYLSLDVGRPPFSQWRGLPQLFADLLSEPGERRPAPWLSWNDYVFSRFLSDAHLFSGGAAHAPFVWFLLFYAGGLGLLAWFWLGGRGSRGTLGLACACLVGIATLGGYLYFDRGSHRPDGLLVSSDLLETYPDGYAEVQSSVGLFATRRREIRLQLARDWSDLELVQPRLAREAAPPVVIQEGASGSLLRFPSREWNFRLLKARSVAPFSLGVHVARQGDRLSLEFANGSGRELTECWLFLSGKAYPLGDVTAGSTLKRTLTIGPEGESAAGLGGKVSAQRVPFKEKAREALFRYSFFPEGRPRARWDESEAVIVGWVEGDLERFWVEDAAVVTYRYSLFRAAVSLIGQDGEEE